MVAALSLLCGATTSTSTPWVSRFSACAFWRASSLLATCTSTLAPRDSAWATNWSRSRCQRSSRTVSSERPITIGLDVGVPALFGWQPSADSAARNARMLRRMRITRGARGRRRTGASLVGAPGSVNVRLRRHVHLEVFGAAQHLAVAIDPALHGGQGGSVGPDTLRLERGDRVRTRLQQEIDEQRLALDLRAPHFEVNVGRVALVPAGHAGFEAVFAPRVRAQDPTQPRLLRVLRRRVVAIRVGVVDVHVRSEESR